MTPQYVGPRPIISEHGISFDKNEPDKYLFLHAVIELLEVIEECVHDKSCKINSDGIIDLLEWKGIDFVHNELSELITKHCQNVDELIAQKDQKTEHTLLTLTNRITQNSLLTADAKQAWLGNLKIMHNYMIQFMENEFIYEHMIQMLAEDIRNKDIREIRFSLHRNYGYVMSHLHEVTSLVYKHSFQSDVVIETYDNQIIGRFTLK